MAKCPVCGAELPDDELAKAHKHAWSDVYEKFYARQQPPIKTTPTKSSLPSSPARPFFSQLELMQPNENDEDED